MYSKQTSDNPEVIYTNMDKNHAVAFWEKKGFILSCVFAAIWLAFIWDYLTASDWWSGRYVLSPAELIGGICGLFLPVVIMFLVTAYFDRSAQVAAEAKHLQSYLNDLVYPTDEGAVYTRTLTEALRTQIKEFRAVFAQVNQETQSVRGDLKKWIADLSQIMKQVDSQTMDSAHVMAEHIQKLTEMTEEANKQSEQSAQVFVRQADILAKVITQADEKMRALSNVLSTHTGDVQNMSHALETANNRTISSLDKAGQIVTQMSERSQQMENAIVSYGTDISKYNTRLFANLDKVLAVFKNQSVMLDNEVQKITNRIVVLSDTLNGNAKGMLQTTAGTIKELQGVDKHFEESANKMRKVLVAMKEDVEQIKTEMQTNVQKAAVVFPTAHQQVQTDLLQDATVILDRLQGFSVDMAHIFTPKSEDALWKKYYDGDKAVFMRHITKMISAAQHKKIMNLYEKNEDFRLAVTRYMAEFEGMTKKAQEGEESKLLMSVLIGSDVGRLYMVLADVLKKGE